MTAVIRREDDLVIFQDPIVGDVEEVDDGICQRVPYSGSSAILVKTAIVAPTGAAENARFYRDGGNRLVSPKCRTHISRE
jgi:hypothetical protein